MQLDVTMVLAASGSKLDFCDKAFFEPVTFCGTEYIFTKEIEVCGRVVNQEGILNLDAVVKGEVTVNCARCGKPSTSEFSYELNEKLIKQGSGCTDEDATLFEGSVIDIDDLSLNGFLMNAPVKYLCKEDCKGICPSCGKNRNEGDCGCEEQDIDPRLEILNNIKF